MSVGYITYYTFTVFTILMLDKSAVVSSLQSHHFGFHIEFRVFDHLSKNFLTSRDPWKFHGEDLPYFDLCTPCTPF